MIKNLPFATSATPVHLPAGVSVNVEANEIMLWAALTPKGERALPAGAKPFPVILHTGNNHNLVIRDRHLLEWAHLDQAIFRRIGETRCAVTGKKLLLLPFNVWLLCNDPGTRKIRQDRSAICLELDNGIVVSPQGAAPAPRLPILGMRGLVSNKLSLTVDCSKNRISIL